ncbi:septation protein SepH [Corynebacterium terpenotabidum]|uniref:DUF3071 domain-containing protein n=1 Tax=Corynebacterium terpenotabidum Y-11 TaxID=1200352 RepID=S4XHW5_9CORY|nr:septation protein SepH [Corynebacterium terpenotabidum]AGP30218.1 hypothetical protein A606_02825 [Corynebacterium terpenotabidum Y-11]
MQELQFVPEDSDGDALILRSASDDLRFRVPVTDDLRALLAPVPAGPATPPAEDAPADQDAPAPADAAPVAPEPVKEKVKLRPREIQKRLRHGATVAELAAETGASETRLLPYAHPIEMERHRMAELARQAYPVRADGPAEHTLWEVLAASFGARGEDVRAAIWDAAMDSSDAWVISVRWTRGNRAGATEFVAEFRWVPPSPPGHGPATVEPRNSVATDLIDPRFSRPVRSMSPVLGEDAGDMTDATDSVIDDGSVDADRADDAASPDRNDSEDVTGAVDLFGEPDTRSHPAKKRRSTATPHWEDVLLGVRTTPRRKK